jgi:hypothetical protein
VNKVEKYRFKETPHVVAVSLHDTSGGLESSRHGLNGAELAPDKFKLIYFNN